MAEMAATPIPASAVQSPATPLLSGVQLATAFDGRLETTRTSVRYRLTVLLVFCAMILLPTVYLGIIAAAAYGVCWYAMNASSILEAVHGFSGLIAALAIYVGPLFVGGLLIVFMVLPVFWRSRKTDRPMWVDRREQPLLYAYIEKLCEVMGAPRPARIDVIANANAAAHIDNGLLGLIGRRLVLTIGLPLVQAMDLRQFTGVLAHELGHFTQGGSMRLMYAIRRINWWFVRLAYGHSGVDDVIDDMLANKPHWTLALIGLTSRLVVLLVRLLLMALAQLSHALSMHLSRQSEFDADRQAARIVGGEVLGQSLQMLPFIDTACNLAITKAKLAWAQRALPDDLVILTDTFQRVMPASMKDKITAQILVRDAHWFDTHPPLFKRVASLKRARVQGVLRLNAPATFLFRDFTELCKMASLSLYIGALGKALKPEHLVPTNIQATNAR